MARALESAVRVCPEAHKSEGQGIEDRQPLTKVKLTGNCLEVSLFPERMLAVWYRAETFKERYCQINDERQNMTFGDAIEVLKQGGAIRRKGWNGKGMFVIKQVPSHIDSNIIPKMQSLPQSAKDLIMKGKGFIDYTCQCLIYNENTGRADSWNPSIADVFAEDWEIVL